MAHCLQRQREFLFTYPDQPLPAEVQQAYEDLVARRRQGEPIAYLIGRRAFWDIELQVNQRVLIPRPETELLVEAALELGAGDNRLRVADLGTGSGAIVLAIAHSRPDWELQAVDVSAEALAVAQANGEQLGLHNVTFTEGSWCQPLAAEAFDLMISNPPYVAIGDEHLQRGDLRYEPVLALQSGQDGYADLFTIIDESRRCLKKDAWLLLEHGLGQDQVLAGRLQSAGFVDIESRQDLAGIARITLGRWPGKQAAACN